MARFNTRKICLNIRNSFSVHVSVASFAQSENEMLSLAIYSMQCILIICQFRTMCIKIRNNFYFIMYLVNVQPLSCDYLRKDLYKFKLVQMYRALFLDRIVYSNGKVVSVNSWNGITELPNYTRALYCKRVHSIVSNVAYSITSLFYVRRPMVFLESISSERKFSGNLVRNETLDPLKLRNAVQYKVT